MIVGDLKWDEGLLQDIAAELELRQPNRDAAESVLVELSDHIDVREDPSRFVAVVDTATAVGKTYTAAAIIDYLARDRGWTDFLIVTPGRIVRDKTIQTFSTGTSRSLIGQMESRVEVITVDTFDSILANAAMADPNSVKVYILTIQALLAPPNSQANRRTHSFQETLGGAFYERLQNLENLVVIADEHHRYRGSEFSKAIDDLHATAMIGLTATPAKADLPDVVYRYPLAAAIAEGWVKRPTIVGRSDDLSDLRTQLADGLNIVERKREVAAANAEALGISTNPVMFVVCRDIAEANDLAEVVRDISFAQGRYAGDSVLVIHSGAKEEDEAGAWAKLSAVEHPLSPVRIIFSVGMLREGWDVKNVYVLMSTRPSISQVLTEQVLGRGLRLPYGKLTQIPLLDTLDVIAHEQYEKLLSSSGILNETFVSHVTRQRAARDSDGKLVKQEVNTPVQVAVEPTTQLTTTTEPAGPATAGDGYTPVIELVDSATRQAEIHQPEQGAGPQPVPVTLGAPLVQLPTLTRTEKATEWSLTEITDLTQFVDLGRTIAADPPQYLRRSTVEARSVRHVDGTITTQISQAAAADRIEVSSSTVPTEDARERLIDAIMGSKTVSARADRAPSERKAAGAIVDRFIHGLNGDAQNLLSAYLTRATARLLKALEEARKRTAALPTYENRVDFKPLVLVRDNYRPTDTAIASNFPLAKLRGIAFEGFKRAVFGLNWFDSNTERQLAVLLDEPENPIEWWVRLLTNDLPIMINDRTGNYHPDFIAIDTEGTHWVVETKKNDDMTSEAVVAKREAARLWANTVNANKPDGMPQWRYVLASEMDVEQASGSWNALLKLTNSEWA